MDANALHRRGWSISAIARHLKRNRRTIRRYVTGQQVAGVRAKPQDAVDSLAPYLSYVEARLAEDPHLWARTLHDELAELGYAMAYQTFTRHLRERKLRHCEPCSGVKGRPAAVIEHPAGEETQWDWVELPDPPPGWKFLSGKVFLLVGALVIARWIRAIRLRPHY